VVKKKTFDAAWIRWLGHFSGLKHHHVPLTAAATGEDFPTTCVGFKTFRLPYLRGHHHHHGILEMPVSVKKKE